MKTVKLAIMSDLHFYDDPIKEKPSYLQVGAPNNTKENPIFALQELIEIEKLQVDFLVCAGDLTDRANPKGLREGWRLVNETAKKLGSQLIATAGNHDLDSRHKYDDHDAKGEIQNLIPKFPIDDENLFDHYWSRNFVVFDPEELNVRFLILNSAAFHGYSNESEHGRVSSRTIEQMSKKLKSLDDKNVNILVCHHHPHKHGEISGDGYSSMQGGEQLIDLLGSGDFGDWIIIHGHKHVPRICYTAGGTSAPVVFSAGSLAAVLYDEIQGLARNQFYIVEIPIDQELHDAISLRGEFIAWDWIATIGWQKPGKNSGLPAKGGFGYRGNINNLTQKIKTYLDTSNEPYFDYEVIVSQFDELKYLLPMDVTKLKTSLERKGIDVVADENCQIKQLAIGKSYNECK